MQSLLQKLLFGNAGGGGGGNPALNLSFVDGGTFDPRITFSRTSNATLTDSNGRVSYAPHNLLANSEDFEAAGWQKRSSTISANSTVAPDGTTTADKWVETATSADHGSGGTGSGAVVGLRYTQSIYLKAAERQYVRFYDVIQGTDSFTVDLVTGTWVTNAGSPSVVMTSVGNGWWRISYSSVATVSATALYFIASLNAGGTSIIYLGDVNSGFFSWGAQLNIANAPVNLLTWSEDFSNAAWTKRGTCTVTPNAIAAPDGTITADLISGVNTIGNDIYSTVATIPLNAPASPSFYINKVSTTGTLRVGNPSDSSKGNWHVDLALVGSGWQRITLGHPAVTVVASFVGNGGSDGLIFLAQAGGPLSFYLWGAQLNTGSTALPYVATTSSIYLPPAYNFTTPKNLLGFTQEFDNAAWTKSNATVSANVTADPNGYTTADKLVEDATNNVHQVFAAITLIVNGVYGWSIYAKAAERNWIWVNAQDGSDRRTWFNLANGTVGTNAAGNTASITAVGGGWYRCSVNRTAAAASSFFAVGTATADNVVTYTGDGTSGIFIWGAQLSNSASVDPYVYNPQAAPTSTAYYGPRIDYDPVTLASRGLLIEEQRTNLLTYSEDFSNAAWTKQQSTISANSAVAPDGVTTADKVIPNSGFEGYVFRGTTIVSGAAAFSIYVKAAEWNFVYVAFGASFSPTNGTYIRLSDGAVTSGSGFTAQSVGNGWYRISGSSTYSTAADNSVYVIPTNSGVAPRTTGDGTSGIYLWGAQMEAGAFATSYVPTVASQVTRSGDFASMLGDNFLRWYNATQGVFLVSADSFASSSLLVRQSVVANDGTSANLIRTYTYDGRWGGNVSAGGVSQADLLTSTLSVPNVSVKYALAYQANNFAACINGGTVLTDTAGTVPTVTKLDLGQYSTAGNPLNGRIQQVTYYPSRLTNAALQQITT